ncbi:hypothetical protein A7R75_29295 [Mycolicibacterium llatzerense]|nr:hypothetical protein [Mycolicibacterium llatzerense]MCT7373092.1 hypothetical protein [Mycolicibacterium llatzerense]
MTKPQPDGAGLVVGEPEHRAAVLGVASIESGTDNRNRINAAFGEFAVEDAQPIGAVGIFGVGIRLHCADDVKWSKWRLVAVAVL